MPLYLWIVLSVNLIAFIQLAIDKYLASKGVARIPEAQLIAPALLGGFPGILFGMILFRHKTVKKSFQLKLAFALLLFAGGVYILITRSAA